MNNVIRKKLFILINSLECGGAERVASVLSSQMQKLNVDVSIILLEDKNRFYDTPDVTYIENLGTNNIFKATIGLRRIVLMKKPDAVLSFLHRSNYVNVLCHIWLNNYRCIVSERTFTSKRFSKGVHAKINKLLIRYLYRLSSKIITVSEGVKNDLSNHFGLINNIYAISNPYDIDLIKHRASLKSTFKPKNYICSLGRLEKSKNIDILINAYIKSDIEEELVIIGTGSEDQYLRNIVLNSHYKDKIHFLGLKDNPFPIVKHSRCFVLPSRYEGFPNALLEAMCLGIPVIASDCDSGPGSILMGNAKEDKAVLANFGILIPVGNEDALINAIEMICNDNNLHANLKTKSFQRSLDYSADKIVVDYFNVIFNEHLQRGD